MGFGNIGWFQILVVLLIVLLVFGTKKIRTLGGDLGGAIRDFRKGMSEEEGEDSADGSAESAQKESEAEGSDKAKKSDKKAEKAPKTASTTTKDS
ncbi:MAG: twin-arginine translocase TatA/TatE family subunit [Wenzhouxiangella sp.]